MVVLHTNHGDVTLELDSENSPATVKNFLKYVRDGHYDNTVFHRVIPGFMIQGGGFTPGMKQKPTRAGVTNEANNGLRNDRYTVAMARTSDPHSATAQFFINVGDNVSRLQARRARNTTGIACSARSSTAGRRRRIAGVPTGRSGMRERADRSVVITRAEEVVATHGQARAVPVIRRRRCAARCRRADAR
jgi:peptidyl-prolyl cis-trans isomerase B (cyclophilin B)